MIKLLRQTCEYDLFIRVDCSGKENIKKGKEKKKIDYVFFFNLLNLTENGLKKLLNISKSY